MRKHTGWGKKNESIPFTPKEYESSHLKTSFKQMSYEDYLTKYAKHRKRETTKKKKRTTIKRKTRDPFNIRFRF